jgi:hypothetical protein
MYCEICRGSQIIRLPRYTRAVSTFKIDEIPTVDELPYKEYPCPECAPLIPKERVRVVECHVQADTRYENDIKYLEHITHSAANQIAHMMNEKGFIRIQTLKNDDGELYSFKRKYRVSLAVVAPRDAAAMDAERFAAEEAFASLVVQIASNNIDVWGSYYGHSDILKRDAKRIVSEAITAAKETRPKNIIVK